jgi:hypothetical protein
VTAWVESTAFSIWMRESPSFLAFPLMLSLHAIGMGLAAGINGALALRILGAARGVPIAEIRRFFPAMWFGFWINALSGIALLIAYPTKALTNPVFALKLTLIAIATLVSMAIGRRVFAADAPAERAPVARGLAIVSLTAWTFAIVAGRLLAYTYRHILAGM